MKYTFQFIMLFVLITYGCTNNNEQVNELKKETNNTEKSNEPKVKFGGTYAYGTDPEKEPVGVIKIYPLTATTAVFHIFVMKGGPSYNSGEFFGNMTFKNNTATYKAISNDEFINCHWKFEFKKEELIVTTVDDRYECGFGAGVYADGTYKLTDTSMPEYFIDRTGDTTYFKSLNNERHEVKL